MGNLLVFCGPPGCGKSTLAKEIVQTDSNYVWVSRDEIRNELVGLDKGVDRSKYFSKESLVYSTFIKAIIHNLNLGKHVIADATHTSKSSRQKLLNMISHSPDLKEKHIINLLIFTEPLEVCLRQNALRSGWRKVPEPAIKRMYQELASSLAEIEKEGFDNIGFIEDK